MTLTVMWPVTVMAVMWGCLAQGSSSGPPLPRAPPETDVGVTCNPLSRDVTVCRLQGLVRGHDDVNVTVTVNGCHQPVDVTFRMTSSQNLSWNFTFVPNNQNERVYIPGVYMVPPVPVAPTFLYVREPEEEFRVRNDSTNGALITVEASLVAVLSNNMWEEQEFLNHTFQLPPHCPRSGRGAPVSPHLNAWLTRGLVVAAVLTVLLALAAALAMKRHKLLALLASWRNQGGDDLTLVHHLEQQQHTRPPSGTVLTSEISSKESSSRGADESSKTVINENNNIMSIGEQQQSEGSSDNNPSSQTGRATSSPSGGQPRDGSVSVIMESYSLGTGSRNPQISGDPEEKNVRNEQGNILGKMKKIRETFQVGLKGITFETLKEDQQNLHERENKIPGNRKKENSVVIANPLFKPKLDAASNHLGENKNKILPLDDDPNGPDIFTKAVLVNLSDSYNNIYHPSDDDESTSDVTTTSHGTTLSNLKPITNVTSNADNNSDVSISAGAKVVGRGGSGIISHAAKNGFGYGSREWLDELEGATAVLPPHRHATGKKKKRAMKSTKQDSGKATNGDGGSRGHEERKNKARKVLSETSTTHLKSDAPNGVHSVAERRSTGGGYSKLVNGNGVGLDARKIVKEVLDNGLFDYNHEHDQSHGNGDTSLTNGHTLATEAVGAGPGACHPLALKGLQNGGVRPKTSWAQASVAS